MKDRLILSLGLALTYHLFMLLAMVLFIEAEYYNIYLGMHFFCSIFVTPFLMLLPWGENI